MDFSLEDKIERKRIVYLFSHQIVSATIAYGFILLLSAFYFRELTIKIDYWIAYNTILYMIRVLSITNIQKNIDNYTKEKLHLIESLYSVLLIFVGFGIGSSIYFFIEISSKYMVVVLTVFPLAALIGGSQKLLLSLKANAGYIYGILGGFCSFFIIHDQITAMLIVPSAIVFGLSIIFPGKKSLEEFITIEKSLIEKDTNLKKISEMLDLQKELNDQKAMNIHNSRLSFLGEMAGGLAHEINNPLAIIRSFTEIIQKKLNEDPEKFKEEINMTKHIVTTVERVNIIIKGLLNFSKEDEARVHEKCNAKDILEDSLLLIREKFLSHKIEIHKNVVSSGELLCSKVDLVQVLVSLLSNSFYFIKNMNNPWIEFNIREDNNNVYIELTDSGRAPDKAIQEKIFNPFFSTKPIGEGTGLGLSVSRGIIESNNGTLTFEERQGNPCFILTFPKITN